MKQVVSYLVGRLRLGGLASRRFRDFKIILAISLLAVTMAGLTVADAQSSQSQSVKIVDIYESGLVRSVPTRADTVGQLLERLEIELADNDLVEPALETQISPTEFRIDIYRARPVRVVDGQEIRVITSAHHLPQTIVTEAGYQLNPDDQLSWLDAEIFDRQTLIPTIAITRAAVTSQTETVVETIPFETISTISVDLPACTTQVSVFGVNGSKQVTYVVTEDDQQQPTRQILRQLIINQPVNQQQVRGSITSNIIAPQDRQALMTEAGIAAADWTYVDYIMTRESRWNAAACNSSSAAFGICQALPASKMASAGEDYLTNPSTQMRWCNNYAVARYGGWQAAYNFWLANYWW